MTTSIEIPSFDWATFYYPQLLEALIEFKRKNVPELTDESSQEPLMQMIRAFAVVGHLNNTLVDQVANESTWATARLAETIRNMARLINYELATDAPAQADIIGLLAQPISSAQPLFPLNARVSTRPDDAGLIRTYEVVAGLISQRTDQVAACFSCQGGVYTDHTAGANGAGSFAVWGSTPAAGSASGEGDSILIGHGQVLWDTLNVLVGAAGAAGIVGVWEYYDGNPLKMPPTAVTNHSSFLTLDLTGYLGTANRQGTPIRVTLNTTGAYQDLFSYYQGGVNLVDTTTLLGQSAPSTAIADYTIGSIWERASNLVDITANLQQSGKVSNDLPQSTTQNWSLGTFNGVTAYWQRFRVISTTGPVTIPLLTALQIHLGTQAAKAVAYQGLTQMDDPVGSSDGSANQKFTCSQKNFIAGTMSVYVGTVLWTQVQDFLSSKGTDRHYRLTLGVDDQPTIVFGDGVAGAVPTAGVANILARYRRGAQDDGNVGALAISVDNSGLTYIDRLYNPRPAGGWQQAEGATAASLEQAKMAAPASLRTRDIAYGPTDIEPLAKRAWKLDSTVPKLSRVKIFEESFGPKTVEVCGVVAGGAPPSSLQLGAISQFFNGNRLVRPVLPKRFVANQQVTGTAYIPRAIDITATVYGLGVTVAQIIAALTQLLQPEALKADGVTWEWDFGAMIPYLRLTHEIFKVDDTAIRDVVMPTPSSDLILQPRELPVPGTLNITLLPPSALSTPP